MRGGMSGRYEKLAAPRYAVERTRSGETIRIRAQRPIGTILFLLFWLGGWTVGGIAAMGAAIKQLHPFLAFWLCGWAVGWVAAFASLAWMLFGSETLTVAGRDLEIAYHVGPFSRRKLYRGMDIRNLKLAASGAGAIGSFPFGGEAKSGTIAFDYGARTIRAAAGLSEAEAQMIVQQLGRRLPTRARELDPPAAG